MIYVRCSYSDNVDNSDSELSSNDESIDHELELDADLLDYRQLHPNLGVVHTGEENDDNLANDPNVQFVAGVVHDHYDNVQGLWSDTNNVSPPLNFTGRKQKNIQNIDLIGVFNSILTMRR